MIPCFFWAFHTNKKNKKNQDCFFLMAGTMASCVRFPKNNFESTKNKKKLQTKKKTWTLCIRLAKSVAGCANTATRHAPKDSGWKTCLRCSKNGNRPSGQASMCSWDALLPREFFFSSAGEGGWGSHFFLSLGDGVSYGVRKNRKRKSVV